MKLDEFDMDTASIEDEKWGGDSRHSSRTDDVPLEPMSSRSAAHLPPQHDARDAAGPTV